MSQKRLLLIAGSLFVIASFFLAWRSLTLLENPGNAWWSLAFTHPGEVTSLSFTLVNHSPGTTFTYSITTPDATLVSERAFTVAPGASAEIIVPEIAAPDSKTSLSVTDGSTRQSIYRSRYAP